MRLIKRQTTNLRNINGKGVQYDTKDQVILDSSVGVLMPKGTTSERPTTPTEGYIRYNTTSNEFEGYQDGAWRKIRYKEPNRNPGIIKQTFGPGDDIEVYFGTLDSGDTDYPVPESADSIIVLVENVIQISTTNFVLEQNPVGKPAGWYIKFLTPVPTGKLVTVLHNFDK
jgi:hypothetical protein